MLEFEYKYRGIIVIPVDQFLFTGHFSKDSLYQFVAFMLCVMNKEISLFVQKWELNSCWGKQYHRMLYKSENTFALLRSTAFTYLMLILFDCLKKNY